ncbi:MAG: CRISPR-associated endonuclease Cas2 [Methanosarcinales archaeon]
MRQIIVYDIPEDPLRNKVASAIQDYGFERIQYSVFLGSRTQNVLEMLAIELKDLVKSKEADIRFYQQCDKCIGKTMVVSRIGEEQNREVMFPCPAQ